MTSNNKSHLYELDLIRFLSALAVVFYHFCFRGFTADNMSVVEYALLAPVAKYGYLGVNLFFIISGFVIFMSLEGRSAGQFFAARALRLFPALWTCCLLTVLSILIFQGIEKLPDLKTLLANLFLMVDYLDFLYIDGSYWSLYVEVNFYFLIFITLFFKQGKHLENILYFWLFLTFINYFAAIGGSAGMLMRLQFAPYFIAGALFFLVYKSGLNLKRTLALISAYILTTMYAYREQLNIENYYKTDMSPIVLMVFLTGGFAIFYSIAMRKQWLPKKSYFSYFGICTYPLYLLHQNIGYAILNHFHRQIDKWILLFALIAALVLTSYLIARCFEQPLIRFFKNRFKLG